MKKSNYVLYVVLLAVLAGLVDFVTNLLEMQKSFMGIAVSFTFISFVCWALYFLMASIVNEGAKGFVSILSGAICACFMFLLTFAFSMDPQAWGYWAIPLAVVIVVLIMVPQEKFKFINLSAIFAGTGLFFAAEGSGALDFSGGVFNLAAYAKCIGIEMLYALIGLVAGWLTIKLYVFCAGLGAEKESAVSGAQKEA